MSRPLPRNTVLVGDVHARLAELPDASIDTAITSPPYVALRNYGMPDQIGAAADTESWLADMRHVGREIARVLKPSGSWWLNLGDSYSRHVRTGAPAKSLLLAPERLALALIEDGWTIRNKVIWSKTNPMPASVRDRLSCTWEVVYFLVRSPEYHFDLDAVRVPHRSASRARPTGRPNAAYPPPDAGPPIWAGPLAGSNSGLAKLKAQGMAGHPLGKNPGDVWTMATANFRGEHFAVFPANLVRTPLLATCPERACVRCGTPWRRQPCPPRGHLAELGPLRPGCGCRADSMPGVVLDPFFGTGTVGVVAEAHGRDWVAIELNPAFARIAEDRIAAARRAREDGEEQERAAA